MNKYGFVAALALLLLLIGVNDRLAYAQTSTQKSENLAVCLDGQYPSLCKRQWLTADERTRADEAERSANLKVWPAVLGGCPMGAWLATPAFLR